MHCPIAIFVKLFKTETWRLNIKKCKTFAKPKKIFSTVRVEGNQESFLILRTWGHHHLFFSSLETQTQKNKELIQSCIWLMGAIQWLVYLDFFSNLSDFLPHYSNLVFCSNLFWVSHVYIFDCFLSSFCIFLRFYRCNDYIPKNEA